jgi:hypothetical protein
MNLRMYLIMSRDRVGIYVFDHFIRLISIFLKINLKEILV